MQPTLPRFGHMLLTLYHHLHLSRHFLQPAQHLPIPVYEPEDIIFDTSLLAELPNKDL